MMSSKEVQFPAECRIIVYGINSSTDQLEFRKFFQQFGAVKAVLLEKNHGYGFVQFMEPLAVRRAVSAECLEMDDFPLLVISSTMLEWRYYYNKTINKEAKFEIKEFGIDYQPEIKKIKTNTLSKRTYTDENNNIVIKRDKKDILIPSPNSTDCEIIYYSREQEECVRSVKTKLLAHGLTADSLFCPNNQIPLCKILDNMIKRGCLYAIQFPFDEETPTLVSVLILYGKPEGFRMIPRDNAINFIGNDFRKNRSTEIPKPISIFQDHPLAIQSMLSLLKGGRDLDSTFMYDVLIKYLLGRRDLQKKLVRNYKNEVVM